MYQVMRKLRSTKAELKILNKEGFSDIQAADIQAYNNMMKAQQQLHMDPRDHQKAEEELRTIKKYKETHHAYLEFLSQKAKASWIKDGDENTSLFDQSIRARRLQNQIHGIYDAEAKGHGRKHVLQEIVQEGPLITDEHRAILTAPYTVEEVKKALFSIPGCKAPGTDGFGSYFYRDAWSIIGDEVVAAVLDVLQSGNLLKEDLVKHYGRKHAQPSCLLKIDLQKAYDTVNWEFLQEMLDGLGFPLQFRKLVMECVTTPKFSLMINGNMKGFFKSNRGLRQGDPISPLLFVLCMEYLARILKKVGDFEHFQYHPRCKAVKLSHMCFADDLIMCCKGEFASTYLLLRAFKLFSETTGLQANVGKSALYTRGMNRREQERLIDVSGFQLHKLPFKYLGVPICAKRITSVQCEVLIEKMIARIRIWSSRNLSYTARMQLVNSVLMSLHQYWAQVFVLPQQVL
ncbi:uncharacterized protein LOC104885045 [Beta vulgaris subsp. vulgaris]|uniref:uncharacterized protein LOC104885045 n=1 Tax=Beta vulgaris subsp. vulgaris TaxID=3555 RepID=UPI00053FB84F|nr:uncharacterized protein LOC104885045 [Beta vulgaris subsp. vulgaris]